jgi:hypothetical protein
MSELRRPVALVTGVGRRVGIGAGLAQRLAATGWDIAFTYLGRYDDRMPWGRDTAARDEITEMLAKDGARVFSVEADFEDTASAAEVFRATGEALGPVQALVMSHCESVADRHGLDDAGHARLRRHADATRPDGGAEGHREPGGLPVLTRGRLDERPTPLQQRRYRLALLAVQEGEHCFLSGRRAEESG